MKKIRKMIGIKWKYEFNIAIALAFLITIYAPLEMYFSNIEEFWFNIELMIPSVIITFLIGSIILIIMLMMITKLNRKLGSFLSVILFIIYIATYIQGTFLIYNLPSIDGKNILWSSYRIDNIMTCTIYVSLIIIFLFLKRKISNSAIIKNCSGVSIFLSLILISTLFTLCITNNGLNKKMYLYATKEKQYTMSENRNFIILVLDAWDAYETNKLISGNEEYENIFEDFTYYNNVCSMFPFTKESIPFILSGMKYENELNYSDFKEKQIIESPLLNALDNSQYEIEIYDDELKLNENYGEKRIANYVPSKQKVKSRYKFSKELIKLGGVKFFPYFLKLYCYGCYYDLKYLQADDTNGNYEHFKWELDTFYNEVKNKPISYVTENQFKFIHIEGAHIPFQYNKSVERIDDATYHSNIEACFTTVKAYLTYLKEANVYDDSIIIIMSDHGYNMYDNEDIYGRFNPIFFVKGIGERHEMSINTAPISHEDLQMAYHRLMEGKLGSEIFDYHEGQKRDRRVLYNCEGHVYEYVIHNQAKCFEPLEMTGNDYILK